MRSVVATSIEAGLKDLRQDNLAGTELRHDIPLISRWITQLEAERLRRVAELDRRREYEADGATDTVAWLKENCKQSGKAAKAAVTTAEQMEKVPELASSLAAGEIGTETAVALALTAARVGPEALVESGLIEQAKSESVAEVVRECLALEHRMDSEKALEDARHLYRSRRLRRMFDRSGAYHLEAKLNPEGGAILDAAIESMLSAPGADDDRTSEQRDADALVDVARQLGGHGGEKKALVVITMQAETAMGLSDTPPFLNGVVPIHWESVQRHLCDAAVSFAILNDRGEPVVISSRRRTFRGPTRQALAIKHPTCFWPGCDRPARRCAGHHLDPYRESGVTTLERGGHLCHRHHWMVHEGGWALLQREDRSWAAVPPPGQARAPAA